MASTNTHSTGSHAHKSELEKFALHFEATPVEVTSRKRTVSAL
jgi:hypothetical protein